VAGFTPLELAQKIPVMKAAEMNSLHVETFKKRFPHLCRKVGERRIFVSLLDAITLPPPDTS
jgi:hypothetical protein